MDIGMMIHTFRELVENLLDLPLCVRGEPLLNRYASLFLSSLYSLTLFARFHTFLCFQ